MDQESKGCSGLEDQTLLWTHWWGDVNPACIMKCSAFELLPFSARNRVFHSSTNISSTSYCSDWKSLEPHLDKCGLVAERSCLWDSLSGLLPFVGGWKMLKRIDFGTLHFKMKSVLRPFPLTHPQHLTEIFPSIYHHHPLVPLRKRNETFIFCNENGNPLFPHLEKDAAASAILFAPPSLSWGVERTFPLLRPGYITL